MLVLYSYIANLYIPYLLFALIAQNTRSQRHLTLFYAFFFFRVVDQKHLGEQVSGGASQIPIPEAEASSVGGRFVQFPSVIIGSWSYTCTAWNDKFSNPLEVFSPDFSRNAWLMAEIDSSNFIFAFRNCSTLARFLLIVDNQLAYYHEFGNLIS